MIELTIDHLVLTVAKSTIVVDKPQYLCSMLVFFPTIVLQSFNLQAAIQIIISANSYWFIDMYDCHFSGELGCDYCLLAFPYLMFIISLYCAFFLVLLESLGRQSEEMFSTANYYYYFERYNVMSSFLYFTNIVRLLE